MKQTERAVTKRNERKMNKSKLLSIYPASLSVDSCWSDWWAAHPIRWAEVGLTIMIKIKIRRILAATSQLPERRATAVRTQPAATVSHLVVPCRRVKTSGIRKRPTVAVNIKKQPTASKAV